MEQPHRPPNIRLMPTQLTPCWQHLKKTGQHQCPDMVRWFTLQRAYWDFGFFARTFFRHLCSSPFSVMHQDFCQAEGDPARRGRFEAIAAPRGNAKTTLKLQIKALHAIVYGYEPFILIVGHSFPEAKEKCLAILEELETNQQLIEVYGSLAPTRGRKPGNGRWGQKDFVTRNHVRVVAKSRGQQVRGIRQGQHRPTLILCDDIESLDGVWAPEQRAKTKDWFFKDLIMVGQVDGSTNVTVIGTCLHPESLLSELLHSPGFEGHKYQSIVSYATHTELWEQWKTVYIDLSNPLRKADAHAFYLANEEALLEGSQVLWPEVEPYEVLMRMQVDGGVASFNSEKQNDPYDPERQLFNMQQAKRFKVVMENGRFVEIQRTDSKRRIEAGDLEIVAFHDPALGKKAGQQSEPDYAAIVVVAKDGDGYLYCLDAYIEKDPISRQIDRALDLARKWGFDRLYLEDNGFQELLKAPYQEALNKQPDAYCRLKGVTQTENKYQRISTLEPEITNGHLLFAEELNPRLMEQLTQFPTGYDDGPDALEGAVRQLRRRFDNIRHNGL